MEMGISLHAGSVFKLRHVTKMSLYFLTMQYMCRSDDDCILSLPGTRLTCAPQSSVLYTYTDLSGATVSVATVDRCGCLTG